MLNSKNQQALGKSDLCKLDLYGSAESGSDFSPYIVFKEFH